MHEAAEGQFVIANGLVLGEAVVPHHEIALPPAVAIEGFGSGDVREQLPQEGLAFRVRKAGDFDGESFVDEQDFATRDGMRADDGMRDIRNLFELAFGEGLATARGLLLFVTVAVAVDGVFAFDALAELSGKRVEGVSGAGEQRVAEDFAILHRNLAGVEQRAAAGMGEIGEIGVPILAGVGEPDVAAVLDDVGDGKDFGMAGPEILSRDVDFQVAQAPAEGDVLLFGQALIAKDNDAAIVEDSLDLLKRGGIDRVREIDAGNLGAERRVSGFDLHQLLLSTPTPHRDRLLSPPDRSWESPHADAWRFSSCTEPRRARSGHG